MSFPLLLVLSQQPNIFALAGASEVVSRMCALGIMLFLSIRTRQKCSSSVR